MISLSDFQLGYNDGASLGPGVIVRKSIPPELTLRLVYLYYWHTGVLAMAGKEAWVIFTMRGLEVMRLPACLVPVANVRLGMAYYYEVHQENLGSAAPGTLFWNNTDGSNWEFTIQPFPVTVEADEIRLEHNMTAAVNRSLLACLSLARN